MGEVEGYYGWDSAGEVEGYYVWDSVGEVEGFMLGTVWER